MRTSQAVEVLEIEVSQALFLVSFFAGWMPLTLSAAETGSDLSKKA